MVANMKRISDKYSIDKIVDLSESLISQQGTSLPGLMV